MENIEIVDFLITLVTRYQNCDSFNNDDFEDCEKAKQFLYKIIANNNVFCDKEKCDIAIAYEKHLKQDIENIKNSIKQCYADIERDKLKIMLNIL